MDLTCRLRCFRSLPDGPCSGLLLAGGEEGHETEQIIGGTHDLVETGLVHTEGLEVLCLLIVLELGDLLLDLGGNHEYTGAVLCRVVTHLLDVCIGRTIVSDGILGNVRCIDHRLTGQEVEGVNEGVLIIITGIEADRQLI